MCLRLKGKQKDEKKKPVFRDETCSKCPAGCHRTPKAKKLKMKVVEDRPSEGRDRPPSVLLAEKVTGVS